MSEDWVKSFMEDTARYAEGDDMMAAQVSIAISAKRIAAALEAIALAMTIPPPTIDMSGIDLRAGTPPRD